MNRITEAVMEHGDSKHDSTIDTNISGLMDGRITTGAYTGNDGVNRAIPHGLDAKPKAVWIVQAGFARWYRYIVDTALEYNYSGADRVATVTAKDDTNFYVGDATPISSANYNTTEYTWVAIT